MSVLDFHLLWNQRGHRTEEQASLPAMRAGQWLGGWCWCQWMSAVARTTQFGASTEQACFLQSQTLFNEGTLCSKEPRMGSQRWQFSVSGRMQGSLCPPPGVSSSRSESVGLSDDSSLKERGKDFTRLITNWHSLGHSGTDQNFSFGQSICESWLNATMGIVFKIGQPDKNWAISFRSICVKQ